MTIQDHVIVRYRVFIACNVINHHNCNDILQYNFKYYSI
jgi:hypothetical protein